MQSMVLALKMDEGAKEWLWSLEAGKGKKMSFFTRASGRSTNILILVQ